MVDQLHLSDRILQNLLLKQLKPTFSHVMNPNCYHLRGPSGVKLATQRIKQVLEADAEARRVAREQVGQVNRSNSPIPQPTSEIGQRE